MLKVIRKEIHTLAAGLNPVWNWRSFRPVIETPIETDHRLSALSQDFLANLGAIAGGIAVVYGGALNDLERGVEPKDYDTYLLTPLHPLLAMMMVADWATGNGYKVRSYRRRVAMLWKRLVVETDHGDYDIGVLHDDGMSAQAFLHQLADDPDVSPCARAAMHDRTVAVPRCLQGEREGSLIFRPLSNRRDLFRHLDRWHKYAIVKYPDRPVVYQNPAEAALFADLNARRFEIAARHAELTAQGNRPTDFKPFRPLMPDFYDTLHAQAKAQLT